MAEAAEQLTLAGTQQNQYWRERALAYMRDNNITQAAFAAALGFSNSSGLNQYLKGTYKSPARFEQKLQEFFNISEAAEQLHGLLVLQDLQLCRIDPGDLHLALHGCAPSKPETS